MDDKVKEIEPRCKHLVLDECSQEHHNNCVGLRQCILDMEKQNLALKEELQAYKEDRFCQGGCTVYQFDKIKSLKEKLKLAVKIIKDCRNSIMMDEPDNVLFLLCQALTQIGEVE